jgi:hypothetical protein
MVPMDVKWITVALLSIAALVDAVWDDASTTGSAHTASVHQRVTSTARGDMGDRSNPISRAAAPALADRAAPEPRESPGPPNDAGSGTPDTFANHPVPR